MFDSIIKDAQEKFGLGDKAGSLLASLLGLIVNSENGGIGGFIDRFKDVGLGDLVNSWVTTGDNTPISDEQVETAFGADTISSVAAEADIDRTTTTSALGFMTPRVIDALTPDGEVPDDAGLLSKISGFLSNYGGAVGAAVLGGLGTAGVFASGAADKAGNAAGATVDAGKKVVGAVGDTVGGAMNKVGDVFDGDGDGDGGGILKWLIPLLLLGLLIVLGYMFCGKSQTPPKPVSNTSGNANKANSNANTSAKMFDSSFSITAKDGKYIVSGVVPDQKTLDEIKAKLTAEFGAENVDFSGLKVDANAKPFAAGWWDNFGKLLPSLKGWKDGTLSFAGNAITAASGLPATALEQIKSLFTGWTLPASISGATTDANRTLTEVSLPDGTKLQAYSGGIEDQLIKFVQSDKYKNATDEDLKKPENWFNFDDLNFKYNSSELESSSKRQLDNIVAILKAFPDVKIKIGAYSDKKGDDAYNKKLSDDRAESVKATLEKAGVGAQVPEAEGYGEELAKMPETASDQERAVDRRTAVRLLK